jgi:hypothetical protein
MAQAVPNLTPGGVLFTYDAPYSVHLRTLQGQWDEARVLEDTLQYAREEVKHHGMERTAPLSGSMHSRFAAIIDIAPGQRGNEVVTVAQLDDAQRFKEQSRTINYEAADGFLNSLRTCATDIHTRILILQDRQPWQVKQDWAHQTLFSSHLLGIELGLAPAHVAFLLRLRDQESYTRRYRYPTLVDTCIKFRTTRDETYPPEMIHERTFNLRMIYDRSRVGYQVRHDNVALYLGRKTFGHGSPHTGV